MILKFSEEDLRECVSRYERNIHTTINHMIEFLRHLERQKPPKGKEELKMLLDQGIIGIDLFKAIAETLEHLDAPYEIKII